MFKPIRAMTVVRAVETGFFHNEFGGAAIDAGDPDVSLPESIDPLVASIYSAFAAARRCAPRHQELVRVFINGITE
jgi:hypothetical protein